jgi:ubiquinone/menaquinone biosynthesis C-methylase UbiE
MGAELADGADLEGAARMSLSEHAQRNKEAWTAEAPRYAESADRAWSQEEITWGVWQVPEAELQALPEVAGKDVVELGCGTAYISAWLTRLGGRVTGVDITPAQLDTARAMQAKHGLEFALVEASAEDVPLPDASFDLVVSEYGASIWADPYLWIPQASRLLRPGGELVFLVNGTILVLCFQEQEIPPDQQLRRPYFGMHRFEWPDEPAVDFHLGYGEWIRLLRANGFEVEDLIELQAPEGAQQHRYDALAGPEWARKWPSEEIWRARLRA